MEKEMALSTAIRIAGHWVVCDLESETDGYDSDPEMRDAVNKLISVAKLQIVKPKKIIKGGR